MAEAFARLRLGERGLDVTVSSSGQLEAGYPSPDDVIAVMADRGMDVTGHRSRTFSADIIASADLILGMERRHLTELVAITPGAYTRCFTLPEFVHRLEGLALDPAHQPSLDEIVEMIAAKRTRRDLLRVGVADEITDPMGHSHKVFDRVADEIEGLVDRLIEGLWPAPERPTQSETESVK